MKKRRKRRVYYNWEEEIAKGNTDKFYNSTDYDIWREKVLDNYKYVCQFFIGNWDDGKHKPAKIKPVIADTAHHIIPIKKRPDLALDINNGIALSHEAHEIVEERHIKKFNKLKKPITREKW